MTSAAYRCGDVASFSLGSERELVYSRDSGAAHVVPVDVADLLRRCEHFGNLDQLAAALAADLDLHAEERATLRQELERLIQLQLLIARPDLRLVARDGPAPPPSPGRIAGIGIVTGGRPEAWALALESYVANAVRHARTVEFIVVDESSDAAVTATLATLRRTPAPSVLHASPADRRGFARAVARETGVAEDVVEFGVLGLQECVDRTGAQRNALVLDAAGGAVLTVDGDALCQVVLAPEHGAALTFTSQSVVGPLVAFENHEVARPAPGFADHDVLALHESLLGHDVPALLAAFAERGAPEVDLASPAFLRRLIRGHGRVIITLNGGVPCATIAEGGDCSSPSLGLDTRQLLPPFFPVERGAGLVFGTVLARCWPDALLGWLPFTLVQMPTAPPRLDHDSLLADAAGVPLARVMDLVLRLGDLPPCADAASRLRALGSTLQALAALPPRDFDDLLRLEITRHVAHRLATLEELLDTAKGRHGSRAGDVRAGLRVVRASLVNGAIAVPTDLRAGRTAGEASDLVRRLVREFGRLLEAWPTIVEGAKSLRARAERLARPV